MPYKNSAGNTGIANQYGQWRYFTASLGRLEDYRAPRLNTKIQSVIPKQQMDWGKAAVAAMDGLFGMFEARRDMSYKAADDWLAKHSLEEYHELMKKGEVPFQDDPLAMQRLKFRHGEILSDIAQQDFQARIDKGEFIGMEPEEIDAENFKYMNEVLSKDTDVYPYKADGDYFFNQGFWANSNKFRSQVFSKSKAVDSDYMRQQAMIEAQASLVKIIEGGGTADQINDSFNLINASYGGQFKPVELQKMIAQGIDQLSMTPWGDQVIEQLKDKKVPTLGNITYKDIMGGESGIQALKLNSVNFRYSNNMTLRRSDRNNIERMVDNGAVEDLQNKAMEIRAEDGGDSDRFKLYWNAVAKAQTQRDKLIKARAKQTKEDYLKTANILLADEYLTRLRKGDPVFRRDTRDDFWRALGIELGGFDPNDPDTEKLKLSRDTIYMVFEEAVRSRRYSPQDIAVMAKRTYNTYNPAREYIDRNSRNLFSVIDGQVKNSIANPKTNIKAPENLASMMEIYRADPSAFGNLSDEDTTTMQSLCYGMNAGLFSYEQAVRSMSWYASQDKDSKDLKLIKNKIIKRDITDKLSLTTLGSGGAIDKTPMVKALVQTMAGNFKLMGLDTKDAIDKAVEQINENYYQIGNSMVPRKFFNNSKLSLRGTEMAVSKWANDIEKKLKAMHLDFSGVNIWYTPYSDAIEVLDSGSAKTYFTLTQDDFDKLVDEEADDIRIRVKMEDELRASLSGGVEDWLSMRGEE